MILRYQPIGLKKENFQNFWFQDVQIKPFKSFVLKKFHKKYYFSAKLLDIEVYCALIVLITRWQVLSFLSNLYVNTSWNKSQGIVTVVSFYHAYMPQDWFKCPQKKRRVCVCFCLQRQDRRSQKNRLARIGLKTWQRVIKGSYFVQEKLLKKLNEQPSAECDPSVSTSTFSARRSKITVEEPLEDLESENTETCQGSIELVENLRTWFHLDVSKLILHFRRRKKWDVLDKWCIVLGFRAISGGHITASKVFSVLGLYTWNKNFE